MSWAERRARSPATPAMLATLAAGCLLAGVGPLRAAPAPAPSSAPASAPVPAPAPGHSTMSGHALPRIVATGPRPLLLVDDAPFLMLGAQANNSSNHASVLPAVWQTAGELHANTVEMPVAWAQVEPVEGRFDFGFVDTLLAGARAHRLRLVLLWFGTWKNGGPGYTPEWVRGDPQRFPRKQGVHGEPLAALSPFAHSTLEADRRAFVALMGHLATADPQATVIMVQVENEPGAFGIARDHSPAAEQRYAEPVPTALAGALAKPADSWQATFGALADQAFMSWHTARYIDEIAAAGKAVRALPMYCNAALSDPLSTTPDPQWISSGSPDWNMIDIWKAAAPHIDLVAPDIYTRDWRQVRAYLDAYARPDNALMVPEMGNAADYARFFWAALGRGAIGYAPFGMDATGYSNYPLGAKSLDAETIDAFASKYALLAPMARGWAALAAAHAGWGVAKGADAADQSQRMGRWLVAAQFDRWQIGDESWTFVKPDPAPSTGRPVGGAALLKTGPDEFIAVGSDVRLRFALADPAAGEQWQYLSVEEGRLDERGGWIAARPWNGDQTDYGINLPATPTMLRVRLGTWR